MITRDTIVRTIASIALAAGVCIPAGLVFADEPAATDSANEETYRPAEITDEEVADVLSAFSGPTTLLFSEESTASSSVASGTVELAGETQYDTAAAEALYAFDSSEYAIVASGTSAVDALSATGLAGLLNCPILLCAKDHVPQATADAIASLGVKNVVVVGGTAVISEATASKLGGSVTRLAGDSLYDTQLAVFEYGKQHGTWGKTAFVANGAKSFADALSASPAAYKLKAPVFLADSTGKLPLDSARALISGGFNHVVVVGGTAVVSDEGWGVYQAAAIMGGGGYDDVTRLAGETMYDTSAEVAKWAVSNGYLQWDGAAFSTGRVPYDALAGSVVQGKEGSVLLLVDEGYMASLDAIAQVNANSPISTVKFFGGNAVITPATRTAVLTRLGFMGASIVDRPYNITFDRFVDIEYSSVSQYQNYTRDEVRQSIDPASTPAGSRAFFQFAVLSNGYSGMTAQQLDAFIAANCQYSERSYGVKSKLRGTGAYFIEAAKTYNVNEVYPLSHTVLESAWGCSRLAQGSVKGYEGYLNFYGIGAYDIDPYNGGAAMAKKYNWTDPKSAILGAASWLSRNYINPTVSSAAESGSQDTLWKMRWDAQRAATSGSVWHQYATSRTWATGIAALMADCYSRNGVAYDQCGLTFEVPSFKQ